MDRGGTTGTGGRRTSLVALVIVAITAAACSSGSSGSSNDTVAADPATAGSTTIVVTAPLDATTTVVAGTTSVVVTAPTPSTTEPTTPSTTAPTTPTTTAPAAPSTTAPTTPSTTGSTTSMSTEEIEGLQAGCVYQSDQASCDTLTAQGFGPDGNYGLGNSLTQAPDAALGPDCWNGRTLACLEMETRYTATAADEAAARTFATAIVANDPVTAASVAAAYIPPLLVGMSASPDAAANFQFLFTPGSGFFQVGLGGGVILDCIAAEGLVRLCTYEAD